MKERYLTAFIAIPALLLVVHSGPVMVSLIVTLVALFGSIEFYALMDKCSRPSSRKAGMTAVVLLCACAYIDPAGGRGLDGALICVFLFFILAAEIIRKNVPHGIASCMTTLFGVLYVGWLASRLILLRGVYPAGESLTYLLLFTTWMVDSAAYWVGIKFGKHRLNGVVSPNKSWEGSIAGLLSAPLVVFVCRKVLPGLGILGFSDCVIMGLLLGTGGQFGDLAESLIKRSAGVKDSGDIFPGHGGILDKADSLLFNAPLLYYYVKFFVL